MAGIFLQEEGSGMINGKNMWVFSFLYNKKKEQRYFLTEDKNEYDSWVSAIRQAIGYSNLNDDYEFSEETLGKGRYGIVKLGVHKKHKKKVAIKVIPKENLSDNTNLLIRNEIEILKISQHPNIVNIYNVYENPNFLYISNYLS